VPATVVLLGVTSLLTDVSSEMVTAVLPLYLTYELRFSPLQFGLYTGLAEGVQALVRVAGGVAADRRSRYKALALGGYAMSALTRLALLFTSGAWVRTTAVLLVDRVGKGIRTAPRDAMITFSASPGMLGRAFGVHRALDATGALLGPLLAFALLAALPDAYRTVFLVSFAIALVGVAVLALFVNPVRRVQLPSERFRGVLVHDVLRSGPLRRIAAAATLLGLLTIGDAFVFLGYRRVADIRLEFFPLLFTGMSLVYMLLAVPVGRLADRVGRRVVFLAGYVVLGLVYVVLLDPPSGLPGLVAVLGGLGLFYAATDGVLMAAASELLGHRARATGLAVVATGTALGRFGGSLLFGLVWTRYGPETAFTCFAVAMPVAVLVSWRMTTPRGPGWRDPDVDPVPAPVPVASAAVPVVADGGAR
jgi:MFS family permease